MWVGGGDVWSQVCYCRFIAYNVHSDASMIHILVNTETIYNILTTTLAHFIKLVASSIIKWPTRFLFKHGSINVKMPEYMTSVDYPEHVIKDNEYRTLVILRLILPVNSQHTNLQK